MTVELVFASVDEDKMMVELESASLVDVVRLPVLVSAEDPLVASVEEVVGAPGIGESSLASVLGIL